MAYDTSLEQRIDDEIIEWGIDVHKRKMFGGLGYFIAGNMAFGVAEDKLIMKLTAPDIAQLLKEPGVKPFGSEGHYMKVWCLVEPELLDEDRLPDLLERCRDYSFTLPPKNTPYTQ